MDTQTRIIASLVIFVVGITFALITRWKNPDKTAGLTFMGWSLAGVILAWLW